MSPVVRREPSSTYLLVTSLMQQLFITVLSLMMGTALQLLFCSANAQADEPAARWWKGNLHTHSLWSDGDDFPEMIASWYRERDYNFLALSDHNVLSEGIRWMPLKQIVNRAGEKALDKYRAKFGDAWVETKGEMGSDDAAVRLKPLDEFRCLLEQSGKFILIQGEEISDKADGKPVHMNATNLHELINPLGGATVREAMENNLRSVLEQERRLQREILPHLNHPNFHYAITAEDLASVVSERFFEVYNGHPGVNHLGDDKHPGIERMWDLANALRILSYNTEPLFGIGTDDSHHYHDKGGSRPGRGWVMVRSRYLTPEHLIRAMKAGDFYASSGVTLRDVKFDATARTLSLEIAPDADATYRTEFIATLRPKTDDISESTQMPAADDIGKVVATVDGLTASYTVQGNEAYVRAVVTSSLPPNDPVWDAQRQQAWTQPIVLK
jgi:hypothetical protein